MTRATWETLSSTLLVVVALGMAGSHVHDRLSAESERSDTRIEKWQEHSEPDRSRFPTLSTSGPRTVASQRDRGGMRC